jgi:hypothetical protein
MKRTLIIVMVVLLSLGSVAGFADTTDLKPEVIAVMDKVPTLYGILERELMVSGEIVYSDVQMQVIDGVTMIPLRAVAEALGFQVTWIPATHSAEISAGPHWTSVTIGENSYFKNKMAPAPLSAAPVAIDGRILVPAEWFVTILDSGIKVEETSLNYIDDMVAIHSGYVVEIEVDETFSQRITISSIEGSDDYMNHTIIHTNDAFTLTQKHFDVGDMITVIAPPIMTMSIPGQTSGHIIY